MLLDIVLIILVAAGFINGFRRGLIHSIFAFVALFFGLMLAMKYSYLLSNYLYQQGAAETRFLPFISFVMIFLAALVVMKLCYKLVQSVADSLFLGMINKIVGGMLWAVILVMIYSTVLWYFDKMQFISPEMKATSKSYSYIVSFAPMVIEAFSRLVPWFQGMFEAIEHLFREKPSSPASDGIQV